MRSSLLLATALLVAACSDGDRTASRGATPEAPEAPASAAPLSAAQATALVRLERATGATWRLAVHPRLGTATLLAPSETARALSLAGRSGIDATRAIVADYPELFPVGDAATALRAVREVHDDLGMTHARFDQTKDGVRVEGGELIAHFDAQGALTAVRARIVPGLGTLDLHPSLDAAAALRIAKDDLAAGTAGVDVAALDAASSSELIVFASDEDQPAALAHRVHLRASGDRIVRMEYAVDAHTGRILQKYDDLETVAGSGTGVLGDTKTLQVTQNGTQYTLTDTTRTPNGITTYTAANGTNTPGSLVTSTSATQFDATGVGKGAAVDAHYYAGVVYDYYKKAHARKGIDGNDAAIVSTVHYQSGYDNAFWDGTQMVYGDGDGTQFRAFSASLDVIGHELTHGVTQFESKLQYMNQSGALNEALSDIFGTFVEHSIKDDPKTNWIVGEAITLNGEPVRDMIHPAKEQQPSNMSQLVKTTQDNGGVHINSGIINNAMYLMTIGGTNDASKINVAAGIGWDKSAQLWYRAATNYFTATTDFAGAAADVLLAAKDLQLSANETNIVQCAFIATGIVQGACQPITAPTPTKPDAGADTSADAGAPSGSGTTTPPGPSDSSGTPSSSGETATNDAGAPSGSGNRSSGGTNGARPSRGLVAGDQSGCSVSNGTSATQGAPWGFALALGALGAFLRRRSLRIARR